MFIEATKRTESKMNGICEGVEPNEKETEIIRKKTPLVTLMLMFGKIHPKHFGPVFIMYACMSKQPIITPVY